MNTNIVRYLGICLSVLTVFTFTIAFMTPPLSGPGCTTSCFNYPYTDITSRFPRDYYWMFPAIILCAVYYAFVLSIHYWAPKSKKFFSHLAVSCALLSSGIFITTYFVQLSVVQASLLRGEYDGISILTQFNPHGVFIVLEEIAFIFMSLSFLNLALVFPSAGTGKTLRFIFSANFLLNLLAFIFVIILYGVNREYIYEVAAFSINWLTFIVSGFLVARLVSTKSAIV